MANVVKLYYVDRGTTYKQWELIPNKLLVVEHIADYLATKTALTINDFQYVKNELEIGINVDITQSYSQPKASTTFKYVSIQNDGELIHYYFVKKATWRSKTCVRFELVMDVLNTFQENTDYIFKENTKITREHKDRFELKENDSYMFFNMSNFNDDNPITTGDYIRIYSYPGEESLGYGQVISCDYLTETMWVRIITDNGITEAATPINLHIWKEIEGDEPISAFICTLNSYRFYKELYRKIDYTPEGINPILQCGEGKGKKIEHATNLLRQDWYLLYRNQNDPSESLLNPVECYLIPSEEITIYASGLTAGRLHASAIENNKYYYINLKYSGITLSNGVSLGRYIYYNDFAIVEKQTNGLLSVTYCKGNVGGTYEVYNVETWANIEYITLEDLPQAYSSTPTLYDVEDYIRFVLGNETESWTSSDVDKIIDDISLLDKTDAKNIKLIKLPYCPYNFTITGGKLDLNNSDWNYETLTQANSTTMKVLRLSDLNVPLHSNFTKTDSDEQPLSNLLITDNVEEDINPQLTDLRKDASYESKLFHSEFYSPTYFYDSFSFKMDLEKVDLAQYTLNTDFKLTIDFDTTRTINSKFLFSFASYKIKYGEENYNKILPIARNNEEVLYNVPYINYIRTGYNYDVKNKNLQKVSAWSGVGLSGVATLTSLVLPSVPLKVAGIIGSLVSMAISIKSAITSSQQAENNLKNKILQTQNQTTSVMGSDDVDLMSVYADNRLKYLVYEPYPNFKDLLFKLFFYAGYSSNRMGIPSHNNRVNFDYLECDASIEKLSSIPDDCLNELINCFKSGITYLHKTSRAVDKWDFEQKYENWETKFFEED